MEIQIEIAVEEALPTPQDLGMRAQLRNLLQQGVGRVVQMSASAGQMTLAVEVTALGSAVRRLAELLELLELRDVAVVRGSGGRVLDLNGGALS